MGITEVSYATPAQVKAIYILGRNELQLSDEEVDERIHRRFNRPVTALTRREASELIDLLIDRVKTLTSF